MVLCKIYCSLLISKKVWGEGGSGWRRFMSGKYNLCSFTYLRWGGDPSNVIWLDGGGEGGGGGVAGDFMDGQTYTTFKLNNKIINMYHICLE